MPVAIQEQLKPFLDLFSESIPLSLPLPQALERLRQGLLTAPCGQACSATDRAVDDPLFQLFLSLLGAPASPHWVLASEHHLAYCLSQVMSLHAVPKPVQQLIQASLTRFRDKLDRLAQIRPAPTSSCIRSFPHTKYPLWRFHMESPVYQFGPLSQGYASLAPHLVRYLYILNQIQSREYKHVGKRRAQDTEDLRVKRFEWYVRQARQLVHQFPDELLPISFPYGVNRLLAHPCIKAKPALRRLITLFFVKNPLSLPRGHDPITWHPLNPSAIAASFLGDVSAPPDGIQPRIAVGTHPRPTDFDSAAIPEAEFQECLVDVPPLHPDMTRVDSARPILRRHREIARSRIAVPGTYDLRILQLSTMGTLLRHLPLADPLGHTNSHDLVRCTITLLVALTGQAPASVLTLSVADVEPCPGNDSDPNPSTVRLTYLPHSNEIQYYFPRDWTGYSGMDDLPFLAHCISTTRDIRLPLPPPLGRLLAECHRRWIACQSQKASPDQTPELFGIDDFPEFLRDRETALDRWLNELTPTRQGPVTLQRLAKSFSVHATQRYGLDPVLAAYVAGQFWWHVRSPLQYTAFPAARLTEDYHATVRQYLHDLDHYVMQGESVMGWSSWASADGKNHASPVEVSPQAPAPATSHWHGSRCVPHNSKLQIYFATLKEIIKVLATCTTRFARLWRHNYFTLYVYQAWLFGTLTRPRAVPEINWNRVDLERRRCLIADKNTRYSEERLMVIPPTVAILLETLVRQVNPSTVQLLSTQAPPGDPVLDPLSNPFAFCVKFSTDRKGRVRDSLYASLSPSHIQYLHEEGPASKFLSPLYPYPPNVHRHYVRSYLFEKAKADFEAINYAMSHKHFGYEPYHVYAGTETRSLHRSLADWLKPCLADLGIEPIPW
jgi:hypothetical protein